MINQSDCIILCKQTLMSQTSMCVDKDLQKNSDYNMIPREEWTENSVSMTVTSDAK